MADKDEDNSMPTWNLGGEVELVSVHRYSNSRREVVQHQTEYPDWVARLATNMIEKWGMVAAVPDGEDSSGRTKLRTMTPEELVEHAVTTAEKLTERLRATGHVFKTPSFAELNAAPTSSKE